MPTRLLRWMRSKLWAITARTPRSFVPLAAQSRDPAWLEDLSGERRPLEDETLIGRNRQNDIQIRDPSVSRYHAIIRYVDGQYLVVDLASTNGTFVNGSEVSRARELRPGDRIEFGNVNVVFRSDADGEAAAPGAVGAAGGTTTAQPGRP